MWVSLEKEALIFLIMATRTTLSPQELDQLPKEFYWDADFLYQWEGFWHSRDIIQGTTWLKALCVCIMESKNKGADKGDEDDHDQLQEKSPHDHVKTLEYDLYRNNSDTDFSNMPSPRLLHTHLPYSSLPDSIKNSNCKIVYIARNPKDTLVSIWHFFNKIIRPNQEPYPFEKTYDAFCKGIHPYGPYHDHVLQYWSESLKRPNNILFLKYEDLKRDPKGEVKKLASFLGRPFVNEDEVDKVLWRSSLDRLQNLEVNKNGSFGSGIPNSSVFRLGVVGDWKNHFTTEMKQKLGEITSKKLEGSGLDFET